MSKTDMDERLKDSIEPDSMDKFLAELHEMQSPEIFSPMAVGIGWNEHALPKGFSRQVVRRIKKDAVFEHCDWRVLASAFGLFGFLCVMAIILTNRVLTPLESSGQSQIASGLFWLVVALGVTAGVFSITVMRYGVKKEAFSHRL
jgi:cellulose biosynthesis protein BcsQ